MTEPEYRYVKGQGWVPSVDEVYTGIIGLWYVTLIKRQPVIGEYWWSDSCPLKQTFENLEGGYWNAFNTEDPGTHSYFPVCHREERHATTVMLLKRVDSPTETR